MKYFHHTIAVLLVCSFLLTACAPTTIEAATVTPTPETVKLRFAYNWTAGDAKAEYYEGKIAEYQAAHPEVSIILEATPGLEHQNKIMVDLAGNNLPDLFMYWEGKGFLQPVVDANVALDMNDFFKVSKSTRREQWNESAYGSSTYKGKLVMLPVESFKGFMIANKALFKKYNLEYPATMAELEAVSKVFVRNGIVPILMGSKGGNPGHLFFNEIVYQMGGLSDVMKAGEMGKVPPAFLTAGEIVNKMSADKMFPADTIANGDWGPAVALYNEKKAAMVYCFPWKIGDINKALLADTEVIDFPKMDGATLDPATFTIGGISMGLMINKASFEDSAKQAALVDFADFLVSDEMFTALGEASMMPAKKVTLDPDQLNPLFVTAVDFTSKQDVYDVAWNYFGGATSQQAYSDAMDTLWAGAPALEVMTKLQIAVEQK